VHKLLGKNDIEDALKRLDTLTMEEARMAIAENLRVTNRVDDKVNKVDDKVDKVDNKVTVLIDAADEEKRSYCNLISVGSLNLSILTESLLREKSKKWLLPRTPLDPSKNHNIARKAHHKGTASWFFQSRIYEEWKSSPSFLWIHGKRTFLSFPLHFLKPH
jgi:hypothetical protein